MEEFVKQMGFADEAEFHRMVAECDLSTPQKMGDFIQWRDTDGTKDGLIKLQSED